MARRPSNVAIAIQIDTEINETARNYAKRTEWDWQEVANIIGQNYTIRIRVSHGRKHMVILIAKQTMKILTKAGYACVLYGKRVRIGDGNMPCNYVQEIDVAKLKTADTPKVADKPEEAEMSGGPSRGILEQSAKLDHKEEVQRLARGYCEMAKRALAERENDGYDYYDIRIVAEDEDTAFKIALATALLLSEGGYVPIKSGEVSSSRVCDEPGYYQDLRVHRNKKEAVVQTPEPKAPERAVDRLTAKYNSVVEKYEQECEDIAKKELEKILSSADKAVEGRRPEITFKVYSLGYQERLEKILSLLTKKLEKDEGLTVVKTGVILSTSQTSKELYQELLISGWAPADTTKEETKKPAKPVMRGQEGPGSPEGPREILVQKERQSGPEDFGGSDFPFNPLDHEQTK